MDTLPSMHELTHSDKLPFIIGSYESAGDGVEDVDNGDGTSMLHDFAAEILRNGNATLARPRIAVLDLVSPMPANGRSMHEGDRPSDDPWKLNIREYWRHQTEGERIAQDMSLSEMAYAGKNSGSSRARNLCARRWVIS